MICPVTQDEMREIRNEENRCHWWCPKCGCVVEVSRECKSPVWGLVDAIFVPTDARKYRNAKAILEREA